MGSSPIQFKRGSRLEELDVAPLSLVKKALSVDGDDDDELIGQFMASAKEFVETVIHRPLDRYQWSVTYGDLEKDEPLVIPVAPVVEIESPDGMGQVPYFTRNGFDAFVEYEAVANLPSPRVLTVTTDWNDHLQGIIHPFLTVCAEMYRHREAV